jgi:hypothetical protein
VDQIAGTIRSMLDDPARTRTMGEAARALVDGLGTSRVLGAMRSLGSV